jgi:endonuclease YncB( thermonuclease family)
MTRATETEPGAGALNEGAGASAPSRLPEPKMTCAQILERLQAEVDKQRPLEDKRRAAAILAETSIRFVDEPDGKGFVIAGPDGEPRMIARDGETVPFTLQDLAAEVRTKYPALFHHDGAGDDAPAVEAPQPQKAPAPRDWLMVGSGESERPPADTGAPEDATRQPSAAAPPTGQAVFSESLTSQTPEPPPHPPSSIVAEDRKLDGEPDSGSALAHPAKEPHLTPPGPSGFEARFRPSHALYAGALLAACAFLLFMFSGPRSNAPRKDETAQAAKSQPRPGPTAAAPGAPDPPVAQPARPRDSIAGPAEVVDTSTLRVEGKVLRLFGVEWARGGDAEDLTRYLAGREVVCMPTVRSDRHRCQVEGRDLSEVVLFNGGGRATPDATPELKAAEAKARAAGHGVWQKP